METTGGVRRAAILGTGVIGTSIALALRRQGVAVALSDRDPGALAQAVSRGAGTVLRPGDPTCDVVVVATPPAQVPPTLRDAQRLGLGLAYTDVAGAKAAVVAAAGAAGCDLATFVPGHPMAGSELSGPGAAREDLFAGRTWALCLDTGSTAGAVELVTALVRGCGARPYAIGATAHDDAVAAVSHVPHLVSAALAARFADPDDPSLALVGRGLRDVTRIAGGSPVLWYDILRHNAEPVTRELREIAAQLLSAARVLADPMADDRALTDLLTCGSQGRRVIESAFTDPRPSLP